jgi:hypothetical protein
MGRTGTLPADGAKCGFADQIEKRPSGIAPVLAALNVRWCAVPVTVNLHTEKEKGVRPS